MNFHLSKSLKCINDGFSRQHAFSMIPKNEGIHGFYKGMLPNLLKVAPYEFVNHLEFPWSGDNCCTSTYIEPLYLLKGCLQFARE